MKNSDLDVLIGKKTDQGIVLSGVAEIKARESNGIKAIGVDYIRRNGYMISIAKINNGLLYASLMGVPFFVMVKMINDNKLLVWDLSKTGYKTSKTSTSKSCNGGTVDDWTAILPFKNANVYDLNPIGSGQ